MNKADKSNDMQKQPMVYIRESNSQIINDEKLGEEVLHQMHEEPLEESSIIHYPLHDGKLEEVVRKIINSRHSDEDVNFVARIIWKRLQDGDDNCFNVLEKIPNVASDVIGRVIDFRDYGINAVQIAIDKKCHRALDKLLTNPKSFNLVEENNFGTSALIKSVSHGPWSNDCYKSLVGGYPSLNLDITDVNGNTALMQSVSRGNGYCAEDLIQRGANVDLSNRKQRTALTYATKRDDQEITKKITNKCAEETLNLADTNELLPLHYAIKNVKKTQRTFPVVKLLTRKNAAIDQKAIDLAKKTENERLIIWLYRELARVNSELASTKEALASRNDSLASRNEALSMSSDTTTAYELRSEASKLRSEAPRLRKEAQKLRKDSAEWQEAADSREARLKEEDRGNPCCNALLEFSAKQASRSGDLARRTCNNRCSGCGSFTGGYCETCSRCCSSFKSVECGKNSKICGPLLGIACLPVIGLGACAVATVCGIKEAVNDAKDNKVGAVEEDLPKNNKVITSQPKGLYRTNRTNRVGIAHSSSQGSSFGRY